MKYKVLIADADEQFRNELVTALKKSDEFEAIGVAADGEQALQMLQAKQADILVLDMLLPKLDGLTLLTHIRNMESPPQILLTSAFINNYVAETAMYLGAQQLLHKPCSMGMIVENLLKLDHNEDKFTSVGG